MVHQSRIMTTWSILKNSQGLSGLFGGINYYLRVINLS